MNQAKVIFLLSIEASDHHIDEILQAHENVFQEACKREFNTFIEILVNVGFQLELNENDKGLIMWFW